MASRFIYISTCLFVCFYIYGSEAIISGGSRGDGNLQQQYNSSTPVHLISITEAPRQAAESKVDSRESQFDNEQGVERQSLRSSSSHHYPEYQHGGFSSYAGGYDFSSFGGGHGSSENSLESSLGGGHEGHGHGHGHGHYIPIHHHHHDHHDHKHNPKAVALKGLLVPLAGVALLGAAAALVSNPILLQLGVITGKRRRRDVDNNIPNLSPEEAEAVKQKLNEIALLERFMAQIPKEQAVSQEKQLLANYLSCTGSTNANSSSGTCLERLTCELHHPESDASQLEKHVMGIVTSEILTNEYVPEGVKERVRSAATTGTRSGSCAEFPCNDLEGN